MATNGCIDGVGFRGGAGEGCGEGVGVGNGTGFRRGNFGSVSCSCMMWRPLPESRQDMTVNCLAGSKRTSSSFWMDEWFFTSFPEWHSIWNKVLSPVLPKKCSHSSTPMDVVHDENPHQMIDFPIGYCFRKSSFTPRCTKRCRDGRRVRAVKTSRKYRSQGFSSFCRSDERRVLLRMT